MNISFMSKYQLIGRNQNLLKCLLLWTKSSSRKSSPSRNDRIAASEYKASGGTAPAQKPQMKPSISPFALGGG